MPCISSCSRRRAFCALALAGAITGFFAAPASGQPSTTQTAPAAQRSQAAPGVPADYRIGPDDVLKITVLEAPDLNQETRVSAAGEISLLLGGTLKVAALTTAEIERALADRLREKYIRNPNVSVQVVEAHSHTVSVLGAVKRPGVFQLRSAKNVLEVLALAEGLAPDAGDTVLIVRADSAAPVAEVNLASLMESKDSELNVPVHPGDVVKVNRQGLVYVIGDVRKPGGYAIQGGRRTALNALALSEGFTGTSAPKKAMILRTGERGDRNVLPIDLDGLMKGKLPDVALQPEDVLFVPTSGAKSFGRALKDVALLGLRIAFVW
jgi:polysaccharide export outer membrane protein